MNKTTLTVAMIACFGLSACQQDKSEENNDIQPDSQIQLSTLAQQESYAFGASMGLYAQNRMKKQTELGVEYDEAAFKQGVADGLANNTVIEMAEIQRLVRTSDANLQSKQKEKTEQLLAENAEKGRAYLADNAKREGVIVTESGLQYEVLSAGTGATPRATDNVEVHYTGTLIDGTKFDSSHDRGQPLQFNLSGVIKGWTEGLMLMQEGAKHRLHIPAELAYGARQQGPLIAPNSTLVFEVELIKVLPQKKD